MGERGQGKTSALQVGMNKEQKMEDHKVAYELRLSGMTYYQVAQRTGFSIGTVRKWCIDAMASAEQESGAELRQIERDRINRLMLKATALMETLERRMHRDAEGDDGFINDKLYVLHNQTNARLQSLSESLRKLEGVDAAERVEIDSTVVELTEAERALKQRITAYNNKNFAEIKEMQDGVRDS